MLNTMRKNTKVIIWFIIISFCLWGAFSVGIQLSEKGQSAGKVFGRPVSIQEFNKFLKASEIFSVTGTRVEDPTILEQHAWQNLIFAREAKRRNIQISDDDVRAELKRLLAEQKVPLDDASYQAWVRAISGGTPRDFEEIVRETLRIQKLLREIQSLPLKDPLSDEELRKQYLLDKRQVAAEIILFADEAEALKFNEPMLNDESWRKTAAETGKPHIESFPLQSLSDTALSFGLSNDQIQLMFDLPIGSVSAPAKTLSGRWIIFVIKDKKDVPETEFDEPGVIDTYRAEQVDRQRYRDFLKWHDDLIKRAHFESYRTHA